MDTQALEAFVTVAESRSFTHAAETLHRSQPAVSKRIAALEQQLGSALFDRVGRRVDLTGSGRALLPYARRVLQEIEDGKRALSHLSEQIGGPLSVGTSHHVGLHRLPPILRSYTQRWPDVELDLTFMDSEDACEAVLHGHLELGIVTLPLKPMPNLDTRLIWPDPLRVVVSRDHPLARIRRPQLRDLAHHQAVLPDERTYTHRIVRAALHNQGIEPKVRLATNYLETLKMLVVIGLGWSVLPETMLDDDLRALDFPRLKMHRDLGVVRHHRRTLSAAAGALLDALPQTTMQSTGS